MHRKNHIKTSIIVIFTALTVGCTTSQNAPQVSPDGMQLKFESRSTLAYKKPGVNFSDYDSVMIAKSQVAFKKNWKRDYNRDQVGLSTRVTDKDVLRIKTEVAKLFDEIFIDEFSENGKNHLVTTASTNTLLIKPAIINLDVYAPDVRSATSSKTYIDEAGEATLYIELFDSVSGEILARIIDAEFVGDDGFIKWANRVTNKVDTKRTIRKWAKTLHTKFENTQTK